MSSLDVVALAQFILWAAAIGQVVLLWLLLRAFAQFRHRSFAVLAASTFFGLALSAVYLGLSLWPSASTTSRGILAAALIGGIAQVPLAIWGAAWLVRSYGHLQRRNAAVLPNTSLERTREG